LFLPQKMDDLLVIILTLVVALVGFLRKKKQKENQAPQPQQAKQPADFTPEKQPVYRFQVQEEGVSDIPDEEKKAVPEKRKKVKICGEEFSLRKAVIYSEILNRKYT